jgi:small subunit ribosomal protein S2
VFVVDVMKEHIAVAEANRLGIPVFGIVDTNSNPNNIDFVIPANDDATKSIEVILSAITAAVKEGLEERKVEKADEEAAAAQAETSQEAPAPKERRTRVRKAADKKEAEKVASVEAPAAEEAQEEAKEAE